MDIGTAEISRIIKQQIQDYDKGVEIQEIGTVLSRKSVQSSPPAMVLPVSMGSIGPPPENSWSFLTGSTVWCLIWRKIT
jgi:hypothetical protein